MSSMPMRLVDQRASGSAVAWTALLFACCGLSIASLGQHTLCFVLFAPAYLAIEARAWTGGTWRDSRRLLRLVTALATGLAVCWSGLFATTQAHAALQRGEVAWPDFDPLIRAGFPFAGILGDGTGGAPDFVALDKGLPIVWANLVVCTAVSWVLLLPLSERALRRIHPPLAAAAAISSVAAAGWFVYYFD